MAEVSTRGPARIRGVLLDVDGTLVDSVDAHAQAWVDALREHGYDVPRERVRPLVGMGGDKVLPELTGLDNESAQGKRITDRRAQLLKERYLPGVQPFPGARQLVQRLREIGLRVVVATSAQEDELQGLLNAADCADLIEETTSASDADQSKPDPDIVQAALDRIGVPAAEALMLGDTPWDIESAGRAGVRVVALRCGGWDDADLRGALAVYDDPADLVARFADSPFAAPAA